MKGWLARVVSLPFGVNTRDQSTANRRDSAAGLEATWEHATEWINEQATAEESHGRFLVSMRLRDVMKAIAKPTITPSSERTQVDPEDRRLLEAVYDSMRQSANIVYGSGSHDERLLSGRLKQLAAEFHRDFLSEWRRE